MRYAIAALDRVGQALELLEAEVEEVVEPEQRLDGLVVEDPRRLQVAHVQVLLVQHGEFLSGNLGTREPAEHALLGFQGMI